MDKYLSLLLRMTLLIVVVLFALIGPIWLLFSDHYAHRADAMGAMFAIALALSLYEYWKYRQKLGARFRAVILATSIIVIILSACIWAADFLDKIAFGESFLCLALYYGSIIKNIYIGVKVDRGNLDCGHA